MDLEELIRITARNYDICIFRNDINWTIEEQEERERWQRYRQEEMQSAGIIKWQGLKFYVYNGVFHPYLDSYPLADLINEERCLPSNILDIGTGSGNITIFTARKYPASTVAAVDIDPNAIENMRYNLRLKLNEDVRQRIAERISDVYSELYSFESYDLIVGNLPFVSKGEGLNRAICDPSIHSYEKLFNQADKYLKKKGVILLAYANFAPILDLLQMAGETGYSCELTHLLRMSSMNDKRLRLGLNGDYGVFENQEADRRVFYALKFKKST